MIIESSAGIKNNKIDNNYIGTIVIIVSSTLTKIVNCLFAMERLK